MREMPVELALIKGEVGGSCPTRPTIYFQWVPRLLSQNLSPQSNPNLSKVAAMCQLTRPTHSRLLRSRQNESTLDSLFRGWCSVKYAAADLFEFENHLTRISPGKSRRIDFHDQQVRYCQVPAAFQTGDVQSSRKPYQFGLPTTNAAVSNRSLATLQILHHRHTFLGRPW
jgi:hypothetical protein